MTKTMSYGANVDPSVHDPNDRHSHLHSRQQVYLLNASLSSVTFFVETDFLGWDTRSPPFTLFLQPQSRNSASAMAGGGCSSHRGRRRCFLYSLECHCPDSGNDAGQRLQPATSSDRRSSIVSLASLRPLERCRGDRSVNSIARDASLIAYALILLLVVQ